MTLALEQLALIRTLQSVNLDKRAFNRLDDPLDYIIEFHSPLSHHKATSTIEDALDDIQFELESVFANEESPVFYILHFSGVSFNDLEGTPFEIAHYLRDRLNLRSVEIDPETDFHPWQRKADIVKEDGNTKFNDLIKGACFKKYKPPQDKAWALRNLNLDKVFERKASLTGAGIKLAQIDTGLAEHEEFDGLVIDDSLGYNLYNPLKGAIDPLEARPFDQIGHGTATSSVIISQGGIDNSSTTAPGYITGAAQGVEFTPYRATRSVIKIKQSRIAAAVDLARQNGEHIITMSLPPISSQLHSVIDQYPALVQVLE